MTHREILEHHVGIYSEWTVDDILDEFDNLLRDFKLCDKSKKSARHIRLYFILPMKALNLVLTRQITDGSVPEPSKILAREPVLAPTSLQSCIPVGINGK